MVDRIGFVLDGCDISFTATAPADITLAQLLKQADRIIPHWCACGIRSLDTKRDYSSVDLAFEYDDVRKVDEWAECDIEPSIDNS